MKYMIMLYGSQRDYDAMAGRATGGAEWTPEQVAAMHDFMGKWNQELIDSGEFVDAQGLADPVHTRRVEPGTDGKPVVTDGPYAETTEVLAGYNIVECASFDRAMEIAARVLECPGPEGQGGLYVDVRLIGGDGCDLDE